MQTQIFLVSAAVLAGLSASASASPTQEPTEKAAEDSGELICEKIIVTGSRIGAKKYCGTREQWAEKRRQDREAIDKAQMSPCVQSHNSSSGRPSC
jgi:hypothetical protein